MNKKDILLCFIASPDIKPVSPIQIMKGMFLIKKELNVTDFYEFEPYLYGPCSFEVYRDLQQLVEENLVLSSPSIRGWKYYIISSKGMETFKAISQIMDKDLLEGIIRIKKIIIKKSFIELLRYVYEKYPEYAVNSIINIEVLK